MGVTTTIIPFQFDEEAFKAQIESEVKAGILDLEALNDLRLMVLETIASVTVSSDNFSDTFTDANGYLNTVVTASTTSDYDSTNKLYTNPTGDIVTSSFNAQDQKSAEIGFKSKVDNLYVKSITFKCAFAPNFTGAITVEKNGATIATIPSATYTLNTSYTIPINTVLDTDDTIALVSVSGAFWANTSVPTQTYIDTKTSNKAPSNDNSVELMENYDPLTPSEKEIVLTYNKAKPTSLYFVAFSGVSTSTDVGDLTIELLKDATSLGVFNAFEIYNDLTLADTPNKLIIKQADTSVSKIKKFCLLVD